MGRTELSPEENSFARALGKESKNFVKVFNNLKKQKQDGKYTMSYKDYNAMVKNLSDVAELFNQSDAAVSFRRPKEAPPSAPKKAKSPPRPLGERKAQAVSSVKTIASRANKAEAREQKLRDQLWRAQQKLTKQKEKLSRSQDRISKVLKAEKKAQKKAAGGSRSTSPVTGGRISPTPVTGGRISPIVGGRAKSPVTGGRTSPVPTGRTSPRASSVTGGRTSPVPVSGGRKRRSPRRSPSRR